MKKTRIIAVILAVVTVMGCIFATTVSAEPEYKLGDVTLDTKITTADAKKTLRAVAQLVTLTDAEKLIADVNGDGRITTADAKLLLRMVAQLEEMPDANSVQFRNGDANNDGKLTTNDVKLILKVIAQHTSF